MSLVGGKGSKGAGNSEKEGQRSKGSKGKSHKEGQELKLPRRGILPSKPRSQEESQKDDQEDQEHVKQSGVPLYLF